MNTLILENKGREQRAPHVSACKLSCALLPPRVGQCPRECSAPKFGGLRGTKEKQEKAPALLPRRCGHNRPQCGRFRGRELTLF